MRDAAQIAGYTYGSPALAPSPLSEQDLRLLEAAAAFTEADERALRMAGEVLADQVEEILDLWYSFVGSHPHLVHYFSGPDGRPDETYLARVRARFGQWILDTCTRPHDRDWLAYAHEIGLRHHRTKKNQTDGVASVPHIPLRYLIAFIAPIGLTIRDFLARKGHAAEEVDRMHRAWIKAVVIQVALWAAPYAGEDW